MRTKIWIEKGKLVLTVNAWAYATFDHPHDYQKFPEVPYALEYDLTYDDDGRPAHGSYRGEGSFVTRPDGDYIFLGDPVRQANLVGFKIGSETAESMDKLLHFAAGLKAGFAKGTRIKTSASDVWKDGFAEGRGLRAKG